MKIQKFNEVLIEESKLTKEDLLLFKKLQKKVFDSAKNYISLNQDKLNPDIGEFFVSGVEIIGNEVVIDIEGIDNDDYNIEMDCPIDEFVDVNNNYDSYIAAKKYNI